MGVAGASNGAQNVSQAVLYDYMAANPATKARLIQAQDQIFLGVSQALAAQQAKAAADKAGDGSAGTPSPGGNPPKS
jgi:hypothetical protein